VLDESLASEAGERGFRNFVYGPVTRDEHVHCAHLKLAALITDFPQLITNPAKP
jgi:glycerophosphoryl diester phosphodiesterase